MNNKNFTIALQNWYDHNKRDLPWRDTTDPYRIWLSEIILQQTRVIQGLPYYKKFIDNFPTIKDLAEASEQDILRIWQGLGYYSRARNLHACAQNIVKNLNGKFPESYKDLLLLKGVGTYTAAAIASFSYKEAVAVVDGNVIRVLSRIFGLEKDIATAEGKKHFEKVANEKLDHINPDKHNQAIMEFGALHCTPVAPKCSNCIFKSICFAFNHDLQKVLPVKIKKVKVRERNFTYFILEHKGKFFMKKRVEKDIWEGLFDFFLIENLEEERMNENVITLNKKFLKIRDQTDQEPEIIQHKLTHQKILAHFYYYKINNEQLAYEILNFANFKLYSIEEVIALPKPIIIHNYLFKKLNMLN